MPPDPWDAPPSRHPPDQPLPKLQELARWALQRAAPIVGPVLYGWDEAKLDDLKAKFKPKQLAGGMGCMLACYDVLGILYGGQKSKELGKELAQSARAKAEAYAQAHPDVLARNIEKVEARALADGVVLPRSARWHAIDQMTSPFNNSDLLFEMMQKQNLVGDRVKAADADVEQAIKGMAGGGPGVYFFGLAVNDNHTVTLAVKRAADGSQEMYWLDQTTTGLGTVVKTGELADELKGVGGHTTTTNIYPYRPQ